MRSMWDEAEQVATTDVRLLKTAWDGVLAARNALGSDQELSVEIRYHRETNVILVWADLGHDCGHLAVLAQDEYEWTDPLTRHCHAKKRSGIPSTYHHQ